MKRLQNILSVVVGAVFLFSSTGILVYHSHCSCTNSDYVSIYTQPETCSNDFHSHHHEEGNLENSDVHVCNDCHNHMKDCGCASPEVKYFKLKNQLVDDDARFLKIEPVKIVLFISLINVFDVDEQDKIETSPFYIDPPPQITRSLDFLVKINRLKIPHIA